MADAVIFDIDGTLLDSVDLHARAWQEALSHFGYEIRSTRSGARLAREETSFSQCLLVRRKLNRRQKDIEEFRAALSNGSICSR